jgi:hypothetical protein
MRLSSLRRSKSAASRSKSFPAIANPPCDMPRKHWEFMNGGRE